MAKRDYGFGIALIFLGIMFFLYNADVISLNWMLSILGIISIVVYFIKQQFGYLLGGIILLAAWLVSLINQQTFGDINIASFVFLWILGIISLNMYSKYGSRGYLIFGCILPAIGTYTLVDELTMGNVVWALFLFLGIAFYIMYLVHYKKYYINWPKSLAIVMFILSLMFLLSSQSVVQFGFWKFISYLWPIALIIIGIRIIYNMIKLRQ